MAGCAPKHRGHRRDEPMGLCHAAPLSHLACPVSAVDRAVLVCLHHPRHPPTPPAPGAVCEVRRGGRALHDGPAAVGRWCWRGQCTWCVCAGARRAVVVAVLRAAGGGSCAAVRRDGVSPGGYRHCHTRRAMRHPPAGPLHRDEPPATPHASVRSLPAAACTRRSRGIEEPGAPSPAGCSSSGHRH